MTMPCPFCEILSERVVFEDKLTICIRDKYPVAKGHSLIITRRHVESFFDLTREERLSVDAMLFRVKEELDREFSPSGYNIGVNIGRAAGQTIGHVHVHLIPRYDGDMEDPRGGVRGVIPEKQGYS